VDVIHRLIAEHQAEGHLLPRDRTDIARRAARFVVAVRGSRIAGCAELVPLSRSLAEIRSLVVDGRLRGARLGALVVDELVARATRAGHDRLCALTHAPGYFVRLGFSIVPHIWLPEKIVADCHACPQFRHCGQYAVVRDLPSTRMLSVAPGRG
jgi:N-acetylglutamate synthase-like GNAT family acetyltransferase